MLFCMRLYDKVSCRLDIKRPTLYPFTLFKVKDADV